MITSILNTLPPTLSDKTGWPWTEDTAIECYNREIIYPKISIITPSYNQGLYLEETIRSVLLQNYPNIEYIIIDGGSSDSSPEIINKYSSYITYWESKKDKGQSHAINKGIQKATGDIITWLNSDDFYKPKTLLTVANTFLKNKKYNCVIGKIHVIGNGKSYLVESPIFENVEKTIGYGRIVQPAMFFHSNIYKQLGLLNEGLHYMLDTEWWLKYLMVYGIDKLIEIENPLVNFRLHPISKTSSQKNGFIRDRDSVYFSIATQCNLPELAKIIEDFNFVNYDYSFSFPAKTNIDLIKKAMNYFFLLRGNEHYVRLEKKSAEKYFSVINSNLLLKEDAAYLKKIQLRNKYIPQFIIKLFRKK